jgi:integrase
VLRWLRETHGAPKLDHYVRRYSGVRPRNITARRAEIDALLEAAPDGLRLWLLLCSDLAIRSGTAAAIGPANYDPESAQLRFTTKHHAQMTMPVTEEIRDLIAKCDKDDPTPYARQLWQQGRAKQNRPLTSGFEKGGTLRRHFRELCAEIGITRRITPHDMRRASAVSMLEQTHDVRDVQALLGHRNLTSTLWYLDHDLRPVKRATLELIKTAAWRKEQTG